jgi:hypothetical protein
MTNNIKCEGNVVVDSSAKPSNNDGKCWLIRPVAGDKCKRMRAGRLSFTNGKCDQHSKKSREVVFTLDNCNK